MPDDISNLAQRARQAIPGVQDVFGGQSAVLDSLYNRYVNPTLQGLASAATLPGDVATGKTTMEDPATQQRAIAAGGMLMSGAPEGALGAGIKAPKGIVAYHGSPYTFDKFDPAKIGTGEGAQVYGHGLYFAENENVAKSYRDTLAAGTDAERVAQYFLNRYGDRKQALQNLQNAFEYGMSNWSNWRRAQEYRDAIDILKNPSWKAPGSMYQVRLHADPEDFLHWNKLLDEQSPAVTEALEQAFPGAQEALQERNIYSNPTGQSFYRYQSEDYLPPEVSQQMQEAGIPGIRYLDRASRQASQGTSNYVVFNPQIIDILKRYGIGTGAGLAALAQLANQQNNAQPPVQ